MINTNFPVLLLGRELGVTPTADLIKEKFKFISVFSTQPTLYFEFPCINNILSIQSRQNILLILTKTGQAFIYDFFFPENIERVAEDSICILKLSLLDNNKLILIYKESTIRGLKFRYQDYPNKASSQLTQIIENLQLMNANIEHFDIGYNNLVLKQSEKFSVIDISNGIIKFESLNPNYIYSHDCVANLHSYSTFHEITMKILSNNSDQSAVIYDPRPLSILDLFPESIIYVQASMLNSIDFETNSINSISEVPPKYFIGKYHSAAVFPRHFIVMNSPWSKLEIAAKLLSADLVGILIVYEKINFRLIVIKDNGEQLKSLNLSIKPVHISLNPDTLEIYVASKTSIQIFE